MHISYDQMLCIFNVIKYIVSHMFGTFLCILGPHVNYVIWQHYLYLLISEILHYYKIS